MTLNYEFAPLTEDNDEINQNIDLNILKTKKYHLYFSENSKLIREKNICYQPTTSLDLAD